MKQLLVCLATFAALCLVSSCNKADVSSLTGKYTAYKAEYFFDGEKIYTYTLTSEEERNEAQNFYLKFDGDNLTYSEGINMIGIFPYTINDGILIWGAFRQWRIKIISKNEFALTEMDSYIGASININNVNEKYTYTTYKGKSIYEYERDFYYEKAGKYYRCNKGSNGNQDYFYDEPWYYFRNN